MGDSIPPEEEDDGDSTWGEIRDCDSETCLADVDRYHIWSDLLR